MKHQCCGIAIDSIPHTCPKCHREYGRLRPAPPPAPPRYDVRDSPREEKKSTGNHALCGAAAGAVYAGPPGALVGFILGSFFGSKK